MNRIHFFGFPLIDVVVIVIYFAVVLWIGFRAMKRIHSAEDYFLAGRKFGKGIQTFAAFGQGTSAETAVGTTTLVSTNGAAGIGLGLVSGIVTMPVLWMTTMWYRRLRYLSLADFFAERYGSRAMAGFYALSQTVMFMIVAAGGFTAMSKTIAAIAEKPASVLSSEEQAELILSTEYQQLRDKDFRLLTPMEHERLRELAELNPRSHFSYVNRTWLTIILAIVILLYAVSGGLEAAFVTDMIQGIFIVLLTLMLIPFAMVKINGMYDVSGVMGTFKALHAQLPEAFFRVLGSPNVPQFTWYFILAYALLFVANTGVQANQLTAAGSAKDDETARVGFLAGIFIKRYCSVVWGFIAMMTLLLYGTKVSDPDYVWGMATRELLPVGLVGLMVACLMAALMSTADALMLTSSSLLTNNLYKPLFPGRSDRHYILAGRVFCLVYVLGGVGIALALDDIYTLFFFMLGFNSIVAATFWVGMTWRRATRMAGWVSIGITFLFTLFLPLFIPLLPGVRTDPDLARQTAGYGVERVYIAKALDVTAREAEIAVWDDLAERGEDVGERPQTLRIGEEFTRYDYIEPKSIFWQTGLHRGADGSTEGGGLLKVELVALEWLGFDLSRNKQSLNETLAAIFRIVIPFGVIFLVSLVTPREDRRRLDFFFARLRTPAVADPVLDAMAVEAVRQNPGLHDDLKLFPRSDWEFRKWTANDWKGQGYVLLGASGVILLLYLLVTVGK